MLVPARLTLRPCLSLGPFRDDLKKDSDVWLVHHVAYAEQSVARTVAAPLRCGVVASSSGISARAGPSAFDAAPLSVPWTFQGRLKKKT